MGYSTHFELGLMNELYDIVDFTKKIPQTIISQGSKCSRAIRSFLSSPSNRAALYAGIGTWSPAPISLASYLLFHHVPEVTDPYYIGASLLVAAPLGYLAVKEWNKDLRLSTG